MQDKLSKNQISKILDITDPFLMIEEFVETEPGYKAFSLMRIHPDAWYLSSHLPGSQVVPASLQIEAMLQTLVLLIYKKIDHGVNRAFIVDVKTKILSMTYNLIC